MRPTSVIFLIFSVILIASGVGVLFLAQSMAESDDIALFAQSLDENDNLVEIYDFTDQSIDRISLTLNGASVNVYGNSEKSYIELINFPKSTYDLSVSSKTINIDNTISLLSLVRIKENGLNFSGLRHYLNTGDYSDKPKTVNIYIKPEEEIKVYNFSISKGDVVIKDITNSADYSISIGSGSIEMSDIESRSTANLSVDSGNVAVNECFIENISILIDSGDIDYTMNSMENQIIDAIVREKGTITVNGKDRGSEYIYESDIDYMAVNAEVKSGNINIEASMLFEN